MNDAERVFYQTASERKRNGVGDRNKKRQGGHSVRLPSDYLTRKEKERMNGECVSYPMNKPMNWAEYQLLPDEIKTEYLKFLAEKYETTLAMLAMMFKKDRRICGFEQRRLKIGQNNPRGRVPKPIMDKWQQFLHGDKPEEPEEKQPKEPQPEKPQPKKEQGNADNLVALLEALRGTGAKVTIEITL